MKIKKRGIMEKRKKDGLEVIKSKRKEKKGKKVKNKIKKKKRKMYE